jgi:hypothetical protein
MPAFIFRCPHTGLKVQGFVDDDVDKGNAFETIACSACGEVHLVNPESGRVVGQDDD